VPSGTPRRKFWEAVFEGAAAEAMLEGDEAKAKELIGAAIEQAAETRHAQGRVLLVGAGPGDPELLTMKAVRALKAADVILYDRLVGEGVLDHARREAELIPVGKAKGQHSVPQDEINALLIARGLSIAAQAPTLFTRLLAGSVTLIFFTYAFVNMGMVSGILPVVGVPLPFLSYGGTALATLFIGIGILMSVHRHRKLVQT